MTPLPVGNVSKKSDAWDIVGTTWAYLFLAGVWLPSVVIVCAFIFIGPLVLIYSFTYVPAYTLACGHTPQRLLPQHPTERFCDPVGPRDPEPMEFLMFWRDQPMAYVNYVYGRK